MMRIAEMLRCRMVLLALCVLAALLSACETTPTLSPAARATATAQAGATATASSQATASAGATATASAGATATAAADPVKLRLVSVSQRGSIAAHDLKLVTTAKVINGTGTAIQLSHPVCQRRLIVLTLYAPSGDYIFDDAVPIECIIPPGQGATMEDEVTVPAGGTYTWTNTDDLSQLWANPESIPARLLQSGQRYLARAELQFWHAGATHRIAMPSDLGQPQGGGERDELTITLR